MRKQFFNLLAEKAKHDPYIILLVGDMGYSYVEKFADKYPNQYINCGLTEQSMIGIACGLADMGFKPYVYSTVNFLIFRSYEQIRNDVCYMNRNVKLVGSLGGEACRKLGFTHNIEEDEDYGILENLPNMKTFLNLDLSDFVEHMGPSYIRLI